MKKSIRFFGGLLHAQETWLNKMADRGYRLVGVDKLIYIFEACEPKRFRYCVEFIGEKSQSGAKQYRVFLEEMGYRVFYKNINLQYAVGKVRWRPWAEKGGQLATSGTTFDRELLIVEKVNDGKPFHLHTTYEDRLRYTRTLRSPYMWLFVMSAALGIVQRTWVWGLFAALSLIPLMAYQLEIMRLKKQAQLQEQ